MTIVSKLTAINSILQEIKAEDPAVAGILYESFGIGLNTLQEIARKGNRDVIDIDEQVEMVTRALGISLHDIVLHIMQKNATTAEVIKQPDEETLSFITSDLDDYEKFIAQAKAQDDLDFLKKQI